MIINHDEIEAHSIACLLVGIVDAANLCDPKSYNLFSGSNLMKFCGHTTIFQLHTRQFALFLPFSGSLRL